jgi:hypothetical protein
MGTKRSSTKTRFARVIEYCVAQWALFIAAGVVLIVVGGALYLLHQYPASAPAPETLTLDEKMAHMDSGTPLPSSQESTMVVPRWMALLIVGFVVFQVLPLFAAAWKARKSDLTHQELRYIEFLTETPLFLGLLGSLVGVCMTQFISGTLAAPLAYLTTISGILFYLFGRFTISVSLPSVDDK